MKKTFRISRFDPETNKSWIQDFELDVKQGMTVLEGLWAIVRHIDGSLSFRYSCRGAVCGSCAMVINEVITLACHTQILDLESDVIRIEPLPRMKVLNDLVVDMEVFLERYNSIDPYLIHSESHDKEVIQSPEARKEIFDSVKCILCTSCHSACPLTAVDVDYLGPAILTAAQRFAFDDRNDKRDDTLKHVNNLEGVASCRTISRCTEVCPKNIGPSLRIKSIKAKLQDRASEGKL